MQGLARPGRGGMGADPSGDDFEGVRSGRPNRL